MTAAVGQLFAATSGRPTAVYRFYDRTGRLLYVGITHNLGSRFGSHERKSAWWADQCSLVVVWRDSRERAAAEERIAIRSEKPLHNISGTRVGRVAARRREQLDDATRKAIGLLVRVEIARRGKRKREVRDALGLSTQAFWLRTSGKTQFRTEELARMSAFLGVPVSAFLPEGIALGGAA